MYPPLHPLDPKLDPFARSPEPVQLLVHLLEPMLDPPSLQPPKSTPERVGAVELVLVPVHDLASRRHSTVDVDDHPFAIGHDGQDWSMCNPRASHAKEGVQQGVVATDNVSRTHKAIESKKLQTRSRHNADDVQNKTSGACTV